MLAREVVHRVGDVERDILGDAAVREDLAREVARAGAELEDPKLPAVQCLAEL